MHAGSQQERVESPDCIIMCHETPYHQIQIHHMPLDFWIMLLRNSEHIRRLWKECRFLRFGSSDPEVEPWTA